MPPERNTEVELSDETMGGVIPKGLFAPLRRGFNVCACAMNDENTLSSAGDAERGTSSWHADCGH